LLLLLLLQVYEDDRPLIAVAAADSSYPLAGMVW
jgi:hypothetical protein